MRLTTVPLITPELAWVRLTWRWDDTKTRHARLKSRSNSNRVTSPIPMRWPGWSSTKKLQTKFPKLPKPPPGERFRIHPALTNRRPQLLLRILLLLILLRRAQLCRHPPRHPPRGRHPPRHPPWALLRMLFAYRLARSRPRMRKQSPRRMPSSPRPRRSVHAWRLSKPGAC